MIPANYLSPLSPMGAFYFFLTVVVFAIAWQIQIKLKHPLLNPTLISILAVIAILVGFDIPYAEYKQGGDGLSNLLDIAVVALGVPLYKQMKDNLRELPGVILVVTISSTFALASTVALALFAGADATLATSLATKSVTTPIAVMITEGLGGTSSLAAISVIFSGLMGAVFGIPALNLLKITRPKARGVAMGVASHVMGTSRIVQDSLQEGAYSALALVLSATTSALLAPMVVPAVINWF